MIETPSPASHPSGRSGLFSTKTGPHHLERLAIVYVRQSSPKQVEENVESTRMQYQLVDRAAMLGWPPDRINVIDDDLGISGRSIEGRPGFQKLLAEVSLDHVGIVLGIEMSRLARSCRDWHQLLELCSVFGTLLADADGIYDPRDHNDRLLLGLKGTMSEAELHVLQGRLRAGQLNKARRGDFFTHAPIGYVRTEDGLAKDPDDQARQVVELLFEKFTELGAMTAVMKYLTTNNISIPVRDHRGPDKGQLRWRKPKQTTVLGLFHHPVYAGAYVYGRREHDPKKIVPGQPAKGRRWANPDDWDVLIKDHLPAYITWEQWEKNQKKLRENSTSYGAGAPRGTSLVAGRVVCGRCGRRMSISYAGQSRARLTCNMQRSHWGLKKCQTLNAAPLHELVEQQLLHSLSAASINVSLAAASDVEADRAKLAGHHRQTVERSVYQSELARRRYEEVDPGNRLVAAELERRWEAQLLEQRQAEESLHRFEQKQPSKLTAAEAKQIQELSQDIPSLWNAPTTSGVDRQTVFRILVDRIEVEIIGSSERVGIVIHWVGGYDSHHEIRRSVQKFEQLESADTIRDAIIEMKRGGISHPIVAKQLNAAGYHSTQGSEFTAAIVSNLCRQFREQGVDLSVSADDRSLTDLAAELGIKRETLNTWRVRGWVHADRTGQRWVFRVDADELARLKKLAKYNRSPLIKTPKELTTPKRKKSPHGP